MQRNDVLIGPARFAATADIDDRLCQLSPVTSLSLSDVRAAALAQASPRP
jgi:hypothetical protein